MKDLFGMPRRQRLRMWLVYSVAFAAIVIGGYLLGRNVINQPWTTRNNVGSAVIGDEIYIVGGQSQSTGMLLDEVLKIDPQRSTLRFVAHLPYNCYQPATAAFDGSLIVAGGYDGSSYRSEILQVTPDGVRIIAELPTPRSYGAAVVIDRTLYYAGGWDGNRTLDEIVAVDLVSGATSVADRFSFPRQFVGAVAVDGRAYFVGGEGSGAAFSDEIVEFDPAIDAIARVGRLPSGRYLTSVVPWQSGLLVFAGKNTRFLDEVVAVSLEGMDIQSEVIYTVADLSWRLAVQTVGESIFIIGGSNPEFSRAIRFMEYIPANGELIPYQLRGQVWK